MFAAMMIPHHQQAVEMSDIILAKKGIDPRVVDLATQIKAAQGPEIQTMKGWLEDWGIPYDDSMSDMGGMGGMDHGDGMMSDDDMAALDAATCLLYTSDAADDLLCVDLGGRRCIKKKKLQTQQETWTSK